MAEMIMDQQRTAILVTGATGFVGRALVRRLRQRGDAVTAWVRDKARAAAILGDGIALLSEDDGESALQRAAQQAEGIVNLAGESVAGGRWNLERKRALFDSRITTTAKIVTGLSRRDQPAALVSASAIGIYGDRGDVWLDERTSYGGDFLADLCDRWERHALEARHFGHRVATIRIGIVLGRDGGALQKMLPAHRLGLGGPLGSGAQFVSWIHLDDLVEVLVCALDDPRYQGPINAVSDEPVTSSVFSKRLGRALNRPAVLKVPRLALRLMVGAGSAALVSSQRVRPARLGDLGFRWRYPTLTGALEHLIGKDPSARDQQNDNHRETRARS